MMSATASRILETVNESGLLLVHDKDLPSVTRLVVGEPIAGSWWSHPLANLIFNSLEEVEDRMVVARLVLRKQTLVAARLWPEIVAIGSERAEWQMRGLDRDAQDLLAVVDAAGDDVVVGPDQRKTVRALEDRLLVHATERHTASGNHEKVYRSWRRWADDNDIVDGPEAGEARRTIEAAIVSWPTSSRSSKQLLPW